MLFASIYISAIAQDCPPQSDGISTPQYEALIEEYCEDGNGISTDPDNLINNACPDLKNDFEWRIKQDPSVVSVNPEFYIVENKHLPDVPSEEEVLANGLDLGEMQAIQQQMIEELTLYIIQLKKEMDAMKVEMESIK